MVFYCGAPGSCSGPGTAGGRPRGGLALCPLPSAPARSPRVSEFRVIIIVIIIIISV